MQTVRIVQAVVLMLIVALAASCAASKEYTSKLFPAKTDNETALEKKEMKFLELDSLQSEREGWVSTDIIMGRDTISNTLALDKLAKTFPAISAKADTVAITPDDKTAPVLVIAKPGPAADYPVAINKNTDEIRNKKIRDK